jgi:hypothetical protein
VGPDLCEIKGVESVVGRVGKGHDLDLHAPLGRVAGVDRLPQVTPVEVGVLGRIASASAWVKFSIPWTVLRWYLMKNRSPAAFIHENVWLPKPCMCR